MTFQLHCLKTRGHCFAITMLIFCFAGIARADINYLYTGDHFSQAYEGSYNQFHLDPWQVTTSDRTTASLTFDSFLAPNLLWMGVQPVSWSINDGVHTLSSSSGAELLFNVTVSTDATGRIFQWAIYAQGPYVPLKVFPELSTYYNGIQGFDRSRGWDSAGYLIGAAYNVPTDSTPPGHWTAGSLVSAVPEPNLFVETLTDAGFVLLLLRKVKRQARPVTETQLPKSARLTKDPS